MRRVITDRGAIIHFAGFHRLSPALDGRSRPAFSAQGADGLARCGWETFFRTLREGGLALDCDPDDAGSARFVPAPSAQPDPGRPSALLAALDHARRFWRALVS